METKAFVKLKKIISLYNCTMEFVLDPVAAFRSLIKNSEKNLATTCLLSSSHTFMLHVFNLYLIVSSTMSVRSNCYRGHQCHTSIYSTSKHFLEREAVRQSPGLSLHMYFFGQEQKHYCFNCGHIQTIQNQTMALCLYRRKKEKSRQHPKVFPGSPPP